VVALVAATVPRRVASASGAVVAAALAAGGAASVVDLRLAILFPALALGWTQLAGL